MPDQKLPAPVKFDWDKHNQHKNLIKHKVSFKFKECEQVFLNEPLKIYPDPNHSKQEKRLVAFGKTKKSRLLTIIFTLRDNQVRIISARPMSKKERKTYAPK